MPGKKTSKPAPRLQVELSGLSSDGGFASDYDVKLEKAAAARKKVEESEKKRKENRAKAHANFSKNLAGLKARIEKSTSEKRKRTQATQKSRLSRFVKALETQQTLEKTIAVKIGDLQARSYNLMCQLHSVFKGRMEDGEKASSFEIFKESQTSGHEKAVRPIVGS